MANPDISQKTDKTRRKSLGMRLSTSAQFTGQIDRVRQNETLASVRHPQPPIYGFFNLTLTSADKAWTTWTII